MIDILLKVPSSISEVSLFFIFIIHVIDVECVEIKYRRKESQSGMKGEVMVSLLIIRRIYVSVHRVIIIMFA